MRLPVRRESSENSPAVRDEFDRLRGQFARQLDQWPDFVRPFALLDEVLRDVVPAADIHETDESYLVEIELPGVKQDDLSVEIVGGQLTVTGERRQRERVGLLRHRSRTTGRYRFDVRLPAEVDGDQVQASLDDGVLTVVVPKVEAARRRRISIKSGSSD